MIRELLGPRGEPSLLHGHSFKLQMTYFYTHVLTRFSALIREGFSCIRRQPTQIYNWSMYREGIAECSVLSRMSTASLLPKLRDRQGRARPKDFKRLRWWCFQDSTGQMHFMNLQQLWQLAQELLKSQLGLLLLRSSTTTKRTLGRKGFIWLVLPHISP